MNRTARRDNAYRIIFQADTPTGRIFDIGLLVAIALSVVVVMLDSVGAIRIAHGPLLYGLDWVFTVLFTIEYGIRLWCARDVKRYAFSFYGMVDLMGVIPTYLGLLLAGSHYLAAIRFLRVLRTFRVLNLSSYQTEIQLWMTALRGARRRLAVFLFLVVTLVVVLGTLMYVVEGRAGGFSSIPKSIYWAIVTLTTVGYGDISPGTPLGQAIAAVIMILGYSIIVVPTGIVSVELSRADRYMSDTACSACKARGHTADAKFCRCCGAELS